MNNPYSDLRRLRAKGRAGHGLRYAIACVTRFPAYLLWLLSRLIPDELGQRLRKRFGFLFVPFRSLADLFMFWLTTRAWKHLLFALPLIIFLAWIASTLFLSKSVSQEEFYKGYRKGLFNAVQGGDYKKADFMAGKLLSKAAFQRDEQMLFAAMIAAHEAGNLPRRDLLRQRLTDDLNSPRAHGWSAKALLAERSKDQTAVPRAIEHFKKAIEASDDPEMIRGMKMQMVEVYYLQERYESAIQILDELGVMDHRMGVLRGRLYLQNGDKLAAKDAAMDTLRSLDSDESVRDDHAKTRLDALTILSDAGGDVKLIKDKLSALIDLLEGKLALDPDQIDLKPLLAQSYAVLGRMMFQDDDVMSRRKALDYFDKCMSSAEVVPPRLANLLLYINNMDSSGMSGQQIREALVHGEGVASGHILLGLDSWRSDRLDKADFHFRMAHAHQPKSLRVLEYIALNIARKDSGSPGTFGLSLQNDPMWRRALKILQLTAEIDEVPLGDNLKFQCLILAEKQYWHEIVAMLEPHIDKISGTYRIEFLQILIRAHAESGNMDMVRKYSQILRGEMEAMQ